MAFYDEAENVEKYIKMCEGYDGRPIYQRLAQFLADKSTLLELGSGGGLDLDELKKHYSVTGSDLSEQFLKHCRHKHPKISFVKLDAHQMNIKDQFDCIYSNKVLHHLTEEQFKESLGKQKEILSNDGIIAHTFWIGEENLNMNGILYTYYTKERLFEHVSKNYDILLSYAYGEFEEGDSLFVIARRKTS